MIWPMANLEPEFCEKCGARFELDDEVVMVAETVNVSSEQALDSMPMLGKTHIYHVDHQPTSETSTVQYLGPLRDLRPDATV